MKKLFLGLFFLLLSLNSFASPVTLENYVSPEDVTIVRMQSNQTLLANAINNADGNLIQDGSISASKLDADANPHNRWNDAFNDFVYSGLLPPTSASLTSTTTAGRAYIEGIRVLKDATQKTYDATKWTYVDLSSNGTYTYSATTIGGSVPSVATSSIRLCRVSTDSIAVTNVRDDRVLGISLAVEDHYRTGFTLSVATPDALTISPGVVYVGSTRIAKTSNTTLSLATAADWATGVTGRATSTMGFVVVDDLGNVYLTATAPTKFDSSGNTSGKLRYSVINDEYYRVIAWFYMNATGSGNIDEWGFGNFKDGAVKNYVQRALVNPLTLDDTVYAEDLTDRTTLKFYSSGEPVLITGTLQDDSVNQQLNTVIVIDDITKDCSISSATNGDGSPFSVHPSWEETLSQGTHTIKIQGKVNSGSLVLDRVAIRAME